MRNIYLISFLILFVFTNINAQKNSFYPEGTKNKNKNSKNRENEKSKEEFQYKTYFFRAIKEKSLENYSEAIKYFEKCIKLDKSLPTPYYEISQIYYYNDEIKKSLEYSEKAYELDNSNTWYALFYAENLFVNNDYYNTIHLYKKLLKEDNDNEDYYLELAKVYLYDNNLLLAIKTYNELEKKKGLNHYTSTQKHKIYLELKDYNKAAKELESLLEEIPDDLEIYEMLSDCYILDGDYDKSFKVLKRISELKPNSISVHLSLADYYLKKGDLEKYKEELLFAFKSEKLDPESKIRKIIPLLTPIYENDLSNIDLLDKLSSELVKVHPENVMVNYIYADVLRFNSQKELALTQYKKVVELDPNQQDAWNELLFLQLNLNQLDSLIIFSYKSLDLYPTNPLFYYLNGLANYYKKNYKQSIESISVGVNFLVGNQNLSSEMYAILGNSYNEIKDYKKSDESYEKALGFLPDNVQVLNNYAYYLSLRGENLERAKEMSLTTIEMFPDEANYYDTYAWILYKMKNFKEAKFWMQKALDINESQTFYNHMADILTELGELEQAELYRNIELKQEDNE